MWYFKGYKSFLKISYLRVPRVLDSCQVVLHIRTIIFYSKIKIQQNMVYHSFQIIFENLISKCSKSSVQSSRFFSNSSTNKYNYILF